MLDIEKTKEILQKILKIMIYIREEATKYQIMVAGDYPVKCFFDEYVEHEFLGWKGPMWNKSNDCGIIMKGFPFGEFITPLGSFHFANTNSAHIKDIDRFYTYCEAKFGIIKLPTRFECFQNRKPLFALSKDIEGNPLPMAARNSDGGYDEDWFSPQSAKIPYEEAKNI